MKNPSFDDLFGSDKIFPKDEEIPDFLMGFKKKPKPDNSLTRFNEMADRLRALNEKIQSKK